MAEPLNHGWSTSGEAYSRKGKTILGGEGGGGGRDVRSRSVSIEVREGEERGGRGVPNMSVESLARAWIDLGGAGRAGNKGAKVRRRVGR